MENFTYQSAPMRVLFGSGTLGQLPAELKRLGISREGTATDVVITSDYNKVLRVFNVTGLLAFPVTWMAVKNC